MKTYKAFTLLELIIVIVIMFTLSTISAVVYRSLVDSFSMNEVSLTIAQDIRDTQRSAMMLERGANERWLHGIGMDFSRIADDREYDIFKWCSAFDFYDESIVSISNVIPNLGSDGVIENAILSLDVADSCLRGEHDSDDVRLVIDTKTFGEYNNLNFSLLSNVYYVVFESVSGKAFFYDGNGKLLNYLKDGENIILNNLFSIERLELELKPIRRAELNTRIIKVHPVSGMLTL